jgi:hypothetical protein
MIDILTLTIIITTLNWANKLTHVPSERKVPGNSLDKLYSGTEILTPPIK